MSTLSEQINYKIIKHDRASRNMVVRPYSPLFKNPPDTYACVNVSLDSLDASQDIAQQIALSIAPIIDNIIASEDPVNQEKINAFVNNNEGQMVTVVNTNKVPEPATAPPASHNPSTHTTSESIKPEDISIQGIHFIN